MVTSLKGLTFIIIFIIVLNTWLTSLEFAISVCPPHHLARNEIILHLLRKVHPDKIAFNY